MKRFAFCTVLLAAATPLFAAGNVIKGCWIGLDSSGFSNNPPLFVIPEASGGLLEDEVITDADGTLYGSKRPGRTKYSNIVLRTFPGTGDLLEGYASDFLVGKIGPTSGEVVSLKKGLNAVNVKLARTIFVGAMPNFVEFPALDGSSKDPGFITVSLSPGAVKNDAVSPLDLGLSKLSPPRTYTAGNFELDVDGSIVPGVMRINPIRVVFTRDAAGNALLSPQNLVVTTDLISGAAFFNWRQHVLNGKVERKSMSVIFHNDAGQEVSRLDLLDCWDAGIDDPVIASLTGEVTTTIAVGSTSYTLG